jgi:CheY-like chemotaxis protein
MNSNLPRRPEAAESAPLVLVIDADRRVHDAMRAHLLAEGFRMASAVTGPEGVRLARELKPAAITLDIMMPGADGWAILTALKSDPALARIPVVVVRFMTDRNLAFALDVADYLVKPLDAGRLGAVLARYSSSADRRSVLIVERGPAMRDLVRRLVEQLGCPTRAVADGKDALSLSRAVRPRLILLDVTIRDFDSQLLEGLRGDDAWVPVPLVLLLPIDPSLEQRRLLDRFLHQALPKGALRGKALVERLKAAVAGRHAEEADTPVTIG